jgi:hypothetical protein
MATARNFEKIVVLLSPTDLFGVSSTSEGKQSHEVLHNRHKHETSHNPLLTQSTCLIELALRNNLLHDFFLGPLLHGRIKPTFSTKPNMTSLTSSLPKVGVDNNIIICPKFRNFFIPNLYLAPLPHSTEATRRLGHLCC